jgi:DNA-directed RNA polymerase subunit RPC12/RpoP
LCAAPVLAGISTAMFEFTTAAVIYCVLVAAVFLALWLWYDRRDHRRFELERRKRTFHCIRCDTLYTAPTGTEVCRCPKCGHENLRLRF